MRRNILVIGLILIQAALLPGGEFFLELKNPERTYGPFSDAAGSIVEVGSLKLTVVESDRAGSFSLKSVTSGKVVGPFEMANGSKVKLGAYEFALKVSDPKAFGQPQAEGQKDRNAGTVQTHPASDNTSVDARQNGLTALHRAAREGDAVSMKLLIERGADVNAIAGGHEAQGCEHTPLLFACVNYVTADADSKRTAHGRPAGAPPKLDAIKLLLDNKANPNTTAYCGEWLTPLGAAAEQGCVDLTKLLLSHGAKDQLKGQLSRSALANAVTGGRPEIVKLLLEAKEDLSLADDRGWQILHYAALNGNEDIIGILLDAGADPNAKGNSGTPLELAVEQGTSVSIVNAYKKHGVQIQSSPRNGMTAIEQIRWALAMGNIDTAKRLIKANPEVLNLPRDDKASATVVQVAIKQTPVGQEEKKALLAWMVEAGLDLKRTGLLHELINYKGCDLETMIFLVESGIDVNSTDKYGATVLRRVKGQRGASAIHGRDTSDLDKAIEYLQSKGAKTML